MTRQMNISVRRWMRFNIVGAGGIVVQFSALWTLTSAVLVSSHLAGHEKKAAVQDALTGIAQGMSVIMSEQAMAAQTAAIVANTSIDGVVQVLQDAGVLQAHKRAPPLSRFPF